LIAPPRRGKRIFGRRPAQRSARPGAPTLALMEFVFVVPRTALFPEFYPQGLVRLSERPGEGLSLAGFEAAIEREGFFVERAYAERTPSLKQVIPYSIVQCAGRVLLTRRLKSGGEARLHGKHSIGIGGHINPEDLGSDAVALVRNPIDAGTRRELDEELTVKGQYKVHRVGVLNDDSNAVGAVHVGVVQVVTVEGDVDIRERNQLEGRLVTLDDLKSLLDRGADFETWSRLLIAHIDELLLVSSVHTDESNSADERAGQLSKPLVVSS
jgi:predicted NUDIX family phosphoesterase